MKVICLGDSFTRGFGVKKHENWISNINIDNMTFVNKGINGDTTSGMLSRLQRDVIDKSPGYVLISGGINDFITGSGVEIPKNNYMAMVHHAYHNMIRPIIGIEPGFSPDNVRSDWAAFADFNEVMKKQTELRTWLHGFSKTFGIPCIDFFEELERVKALYKDTDFYVDGIHMTKEGHKYIADFTAHAVEALLHF